MELQKKAIEHSLEQLKNADYYKVYSDVSDIIISLGIDDDKKKRILDVMGDSHQKFVSENVNEAEKWLSVLLKDLNQKAK